MCLLYPSAAVGCCRRPARPWWPRRRRARLGDVPRADAAVAPVRADIGVSAYAFDLGQVRLTTSRWLDNQNRTLSYLRFVDVDRLLYNFRANHRLSTNGAAANGGWDAPNFPFRTHMQGHFLSAWAQAYAVLGDTTCRDKANAMVAGMAACQANNGAAGFNTGYLSGFPESDFNGLEAGQAVSVSYYCIHKTLAGLLDVWRYIGSTQARDVLLRLAGWVDWRTAPAELRPDADGAGHRVRRDERGAGRHLPADRRRPLADHRPAVRPRRGVQPARVQPGPAQRAAREHAGAQVDRRGPRVQGHRHHPLPRHRRQRVELHRQRPHVRHRRQQPGRALPGAQRDRRLPRQRHLRALQHLQHAQTDQRAVAAQPRQRRRTSTSTNGPCSTTSSARRTPPTATGTSPTSRRSNPAAGAAWARRGAAAPGAPTTTASGAARARHRNQHQADGLDLPLQRHHADREPVHALGAELEPAGDHGHADAPRTRSATPPPCRSPAA